MTTLVRGLGLLALLCSVASGCDDGIADGGGGRTAGRDGAEAPDASTAPSSWFGRTRGGAVVLSRDERVAVVVNRSASIVTVFALDPGASALEELVIGRTELELPEASEPWAAVLGGEGDDAAYVISRRTQVVTRIAPLHGTPERAGDVVVGSEPTAIAISPSGCRLFVANWADGTIHVVPTPKCSGEEEFSSAALATVNGYKALSLNEALVDTGVLGGVTARLGLAHPRALAVTDDGDDSDEDETLYATEFFSMPLPGAREEDATSSLFDRNRQGLVYRVDLQTGVVGKPISIAPIADTGFADATGAATGCFPNQLYAAAASADRLLVTSMCASPAGPLGASKDVPPKLDNFKTVMHPAVFVIDTRSNLELEEGRVLLTRELEPRYAADAQRRMNGDDLADEPVRMPLIPSDIAYTSEDTDSEGARTSCMTALGADAVFCIQQDESGRLLDVGAPGKRYFGLGAQGGHLGARLPVGIAISPTRSFALVAAENTQSLSVLDAAGEVHGWYALRSARAEAIRNSPETAGRAKFVTGLGQWSFKGEARVSCEGCHPDGLSDGVTWFFTRGPRRTISTAGTYASDGSRRVMLWGGNIDEVHDVEVIVRSVAGGVGGILWDYAGPMPQNDARLLYDPAQGAGKRTTFLHNNLNGSTRSLVDPPTPVASCKDSEVCDQSTGRVWDEIDAFVTSVRSPRRPSGLDPDAVLRGAELFRSTGCARCHSGPSWTLSHVFYEPGLAQNGELPSVAPEPFVITDQQLGRLRIETYDVPEELRPLNLPGRESGRATFRLFDPPVGRSAFEHLYGHPTPSEPEAFDSASTHRRDQINCVLRAVGTFPTQPDDPMLPAATDGIVPPGSPSVVRELLQDMKKLADGKSGFNIPSLVGLSAGAPYFHAGNAATLEELFDPTFAQHHQALALGALEGPGRADDVRDLVAFLLSIDDEADGEAMRDARQAGDDLCAPSPGAMR